MKLCPVIGVFLLLSTFSQSPVMGQIKVVEFDSSHRSLKNKALFFTNRPMQNGKAGKVGFKNRWSKESGELHFGWYNYKTDSIDLFYRATKATENKAYPTKAVTNNIFYDIYDKIRIDRNINHLVILIPGYGKTFKVQTHNFMRKVRERYADSLRKDAAFATYAWATESDFLFYFRGKRVAKRGAHDFAIFQHMLEEFQADSAFFATHPNDMSIHLVCLSMGNRLLKHYLKKRDKQGIPVRKSYDNIVLLGADINWNSFHEGKGLDELGKMTDTITLVVNKKDALLQFASIINPTNRMGAKGLKHEEDAPENLFVVHIEEHMSKEDFPGLGHDYFLRNPWIRDEIVGYLGEESIESELSMENKKGKP